MGIPAILIGLTDRQLLLKVAQHPWVVQRVHVASDEIGKAQHLGPGERIGRQQGWLRIALIKKVDDRQRLRDPLSLNLQHGHGSRSIDHAEKCRIAMFSHADIHRHDLVSHPLQGKRNAHSIGCGAVKE